MKRAATALLALVVTAATLSCAAPGLQVRPDDPLPERFSGGGRAAMPDRWWLALGDPVIDRLIDEGLAGNPGLLATWDRLAQADAAVRSAGASRYPSASSELGGGAAAHGDGLDVTGSTSVSLGLAASYEIDLFGGIAAGRDAVAADARATAADLQSSALTLSSEIALTWLQIVEQRQQAALLDRQLETAGQTLAGVELRFQQGVIAETDLLRQRQQVESIQGDRSLAAARLEVLQHKLAILLGRPPGAPIPAGGGFPRVPDLPATGVPGELVQRRPDVLSSLYRIRAADRRLAQAITERFPRLSFSVRLSTTAASPQGLFESWLASLAGNLVQPLFQAGRLQAEVDRARAQLSERMHDYRARVLSALAEVEDALARELRQTEYLASLDRQLELAGGVFARTRQAYAAGAIDYLRVLDAEQTLQSLERRRVTAERELLEYRIALYRSLAGGWAMPRPGP